MFHCRTTSAITLLFVWQCSHRSLSLGPFYVTYATLCKINRGADELLFSPRLHELLMTTYYTVVGLAPMVMEKHDQANVSSETGFDTTLHAFRLILY
ncbi:hypothetical protein EDB89DRAFT_569701 [Lactarius sanguifluus]|nr:hypothetical protein EDB89DRAFT_569701 [Lactarius sanguifluus]